MIFLFLLLPLVNSLNVLIYSAPIGFSQIQMMTSISDTLVGAGHIVTVLAPVVESKMRKEVSRRAHTVFLDVSEEIKEKQKTRTEGFWEISPMFGNLLKIGSVATIQHDVCKYMLEHRSEWIAKLNVSFDVAIVDISGMCGFGLAQMLDVQSMVAVSAIGFMDGISEYFHTPVMTSYVPGSLLFFTDKMSYLERLWNFAWHTGSKPMYSLLLTWKYSKLFESYGVNFDLLGSTLPQTNYLLVNQDEFLGIARPVSQRIKYIGGIAAKPPAKMPEKFEKILNSTQKGVIAMSFGSYATTSDMPKEMKDAFLLAIDGIYSMFELKDYDFIWRVDCKDSGLSEGRKNLHTTSWLPQRELLHHKKVKVFISHAGMNSVLETALAGKPGLFVPIFGDQFQNAATISRKNTSKIVWKSDLRGRAVVDALKELLEDEGYLKRAQRLADLMKSKRSTPAERLLDAVEYTGTFGKIPDLDVEGFNLGYIEYFSIDVFISWIVIIGVISITIHVLVWYPEKITKYL